jgi:hypothetical protein
VKEFIEFDISIATLLVQKDLLHFILHLDKLTGWSDG